MIQPVEMQTALPITLHGNVSTTTTEVWETLVASRNGDLGRVRQLISARPELSTCQFNYTPPLHFAIRHGHLALVRLLVDNLALDPDYKSYPFGDSFLVLARDRGHDEIVRFLEGALARPEVTREWVETGHIDFKQDEQQQRFDKAVHAGNRQDVERLLGERPELARNELSSWAEGVLMMPARRKNWKMLELLMRSGATVPALSKWGRFYYFVHDDIAAFLLDHGMSAHHMTWHNVTLLHDMAQSGEVAKARLLLDHGADIDAVDDEYRTTPLGMAARWGQRKMVSFLLERAANPNKAGASWSTPLAWARTKGHAEIVKDLIAAGAAA
jgi:uncharacterized protein